MYEASLEKREGPFGLRRKSEPLGHIYALQLLKYQINQSNITLYLDQSETMLQIRVQGQPVRVEFPAESNKLKPTLTVTLDQNNPEIILSCEKITVHPETDHSRRLILTSPKFQPLIVDALYSKI